MPKINGIESPIYIGDGVYAKIDEQDPTRIVLTTDTHEIRNATNVIFLEQREMKTLLKFLKLCLGE